MSIHRASVRALLLGAASSPLGAQAEIPNYTSGEGYELSVPYEGGSGTTLAAFPAATLGTLHGAPLASRLLAASGHTLYLQRERASAEWDAVAHTDPLHRDMDPSFVQVTPSGEKIALGEGYMMPLQVFATSLLSTEAPLELAIAEEVHTYEHSYYDAAWRDERYLFLNAGALQAQSSAVYIVDTQEEGPEAITLAISNIPGASAGIAFDRQGNLITGIGYDWAEERTGEIRVFKAADIEALVIDGSPIPYAEKSTLVAENVLSAASLGFDGEGNLLVGGGDVVGSKLGQYGYAAIIDREVLSRVLAGGAPLNPDAPGELTKIVSDPCQNDDTTAIMFVEGLDMLLVSANMDSKPPACAELDLIPATDGRLVAFFPPSAPDEDRDGVPDGIDGVWSPPVVGRTELERLMAAFGASSGDPNFSAAVDQNSDMRIDWGDFDALVLQWGKPIL